MASITTRAGKGSPLTNAEVDTNFTNINGELPSAVLTDQGDILYASAANTAVRLPKNINATRYLSNTGSDNNPAWAQINLANGITGTLPVASGGTGATTSTGSGAVVLATSPTLVTPVLGVAAATSVNKVAVTAPATSATLTLADGSSLITSGGHSLTLTTTATTSVTLPTSGALTNTGKAIAMALVFG